MKTLILAFLLAPLATHAAPSSPALIDMQTGTSNPAPATLDYDSYTKWLGTVLNGADSVSAFTPKIFEWYQNEKNRPLPKEVYADPQRISVNVARPIAETDALEESGDITEGNTVGAEVYAEQTGTIDQALNTMLFRWGKPAAAPEGQAFPPGGPFGKRTDYFAANSDWGTGAYASLTMRRDGGILDSLFDRYLVLIRGDAVKGYDVLMQYVKPGGETSTEKCFAIAMLRPLPGGKVSYKISTRYQGQVYKVLGNVSIGRSQVGFNVSKVRAVQVESNGLLKELQDTGTIKDRTADIGYGK